jgi:hypothetical protein
MIEDTYGRKPDTDPHESSGSNGVDNSLPNPWLDNPRPVSKQYPGIRFRLKEFHNLKRKMHVKGTSWPYRLHPKDETIIYFFEFRGYGVPPNDIGNPGDLYMDLTPSPGPHYLLYIRWEGHWACINWSKNPHKTTFRVPDHPLLKDRLLSGTKESGFSWVTHGTINRRHGYCRWIDMDLMAWKAIEFDNRDGTLHIELNEDALQRKRAEEQRRQKEWDTWLESNPSTTSTEQVSQASARASIQDLIRRKQNEGHHKQTDEAMLHGPSMYPTPPASAAQGPNATPEMQQLDAGHGLGSSSTLKRKRSLAGLTPNPQNKASSSTSLSKHQRRSESTNSPLDACCKRNNIWKSPRLILCTVDVEVEGPAALRNESEEEMEQATGEEERSTKQEPQAERTEGLYHSTANLHVSSDAAQNAMEGVFLQQVCYALFSWQIFRM